MPHFQDAWLSEVVVTLSLNADRPLTHIVEQLRGHGMSIAEIDDVLAIVEGTIETAMVGVIDDLPGVEYVRTHFMYVADYPPGDPRDRDGVARPPSDE